MKKSIKNGRNLRSHTLIENHLQLPPYPLQKLGFHLYMFIHSSTIANYVKFCSNIAKSARASRSLCYIYNVQPDYYSMLQQNERAKRAGSQQDIIIENVSSSVRFVSVCNERLHFMLNAAIL